MLSLWLSGVASAQLAPVAPDWSVQVPAPALLYGLDVGDVDGDGGADLVWSDLVGGNVVVAMYDGATLFAAPVPVDLGGRSSIGELVLLDVDLDGRDDLLVRTSAPRETTGALGGPSGLEAPTLHLPEGALARIGDVDGDGAEDLGIGLGSWLAAAGGPVEDAPIPGNLVYPGSRPWPIGDVDGDGAGDLLVPDHEVSGAYFDSQEGPAALVVRRGGAWDAGWSIDLDGGTAALAVAADVDGDGGREVVTADLTTADEAMWGTLSVLDDLGDPLGPALVTPTEIDLDAGQGFALASLGDTDGDGVDEIVLGASGRITELPWDPASGFDLSGAARVWSLGPGRELGALVTADVDRDGTRDVVATWLGQGPAEVTVWVTGPGGPPLEAGDTGDTGDTGAPTDPGTPLPPQDTAQDTTGAPTDPVDGGDEASGCGCGTPGAPSAAVAWLVVVLLRRRCAER